jgi:hypothetical protein
MNRQYAFIGIACFTAILGITTALFERASYELAEVAEVIALATAASSILICIFAFLWFREGTSSQLVGSAIFVMLLPILVIFFGESLLNVHGAAFPAMLCYALFSELSAVAILLGVGIRTLVRNYRENSR